MATASLATLACSLLKVAPLEVYTSRISLHMLAHGGAILLRKIEWFQPGGCSGVLSAEKRKLRSSAEGAPYPILLFLYRELSDA